MDATIKTENGKSWMECTYSPESCDWDQAIAAALAGLGLRPGQMNVICRPAQSRTSVPAQGALFGEGQGHTR